MGKRCDYKQKRLIYLIDIDKKVCLICYIFICKKQKVNIKKHHEYDT